MAPDGHVDGHVYQGEDVILTQSRQRTKNQRKTQLKYPPTTKKAPKLLRSSSLPPASTLVSTDKLSSGAVRGSEVGRDGGNTGPGFFDRPHVVNFAKSPYSKDGASETSSVAALDSRLKSFHVSHSPDHPPALSTTLQGVKLPRTLIRSLQNLIHFRKVVGDYREEAKDRRDEAMRQRAKARQIQKRVNEHFANQGLQDSQTQGSGSTPNTKRSSQSIDLLHRAAAAWALFAKLDEQLEIAEDRLSGYDYQLEQKEARVYRRLQRVTSHSVPASEDETSQDEDDDVSSVMPGDSQSDDVHTLVGDYFDAVGDINMTRERLNEFEIAHRKNVQELEHEGEEGVPITTMHRQTMEGYFEARATMINELLAAKNKATELRQQCVDQKLFADEEADVDAIEHALKWNVGQGEVGRMYDYHYDEAHRGIRPLEILLIPQTWPEDRVEQWKAQIAAASYGMPIKTIEDQVQSEPRGKTFDGRIGRGSDFQGSSERYRPRHISDSGDITSFHCHRVPPIRRHIDAWSGESVDCSQSEPDVNYREDRALTRGHGDSHQTEQEHRRPRSWVETVRERNGHFIARMVFLNR